MTVSFRPETQQQKFGVLVYKTLKKEFSQTYFVGGMVRNILMKEKVLDIDIATLAHPEEVEKILQLSKIATDFSHSKFGIITATSNKWKVEIATFRRDLPATSRYPKVRFVKSPKADSARRDFTINALYLDYSSGKVYDFHKGLQDLRKRQIKFIGRPAKRIFEDPLRIVRALRFQLQYNLNLEHKTELSIKKNYYLLKKLSQNRIETDILKLMNKKQQMKLKKIINSLHLTNN